MNNKSYRWYKGYLRVEITGDSKERFINLCSSNKISLYDVKKYNDKITFEVDIDSYKKVKKIVRKTHIVPRIYSKCGAPFMLQKLNRRKSFPMGIIIGIIIFYIGSLFVWDISIEGENYYTEYELLECLKYENIKPGMRTKDIVCTDIENLIRKKYNDIGWVSACLKGTRLIISVKENIKFNNKEKELKPRHIVAPVSGIVKSIVVKNGEPLVNIGDEVKKGQILVSGIMEIVDDNLTVVNKHGIESEANIKIQYDKEYYYKINKEYNKKIYTGKYRKIYGVIFNNKNIYSISKPFTYNSIKKFDNFDVIVNNYNVSLCENIELPLKLVKTNVREYKNFKTEYSKEQLEKKANEYFKRYKKELKKENVSIINSSIEHYINETMLYSKGYVTLLCNKMEFKAIKKSELTIETTKVN